MKLWLRHIGWLLARWWRGPATRRAQCLDGCGQEIVQREVSYGIWRDLFCEECLYAQWLARHRRAA